MKALLSSRGSRGDVIPLIEVAAGLAQRGHDVSLCIPQTFVDGAHHRGLSIATTYAEDSHTVMKELGSGWAAAKNALSWFARDFNRQVDQLLEVSDGVDALITSVNEVAPPTVAELRNIAHYRLAYTPVLPGDQPPPMLPWQRLPPWGNRMMWSALNLSIGVVLWSVVSERRRELGLPIVESPAEYFAGRSHTLMAFSPILSPPSASWRHRYSYTGCCFGLEAEGELPGQLSRFLSSGAPPIYFGFGSVDVKNARSLTRRVLEAARRAPCRLVVGSGWAGLDTEGFFDNVIVIDEVPHRLLFPHMAAVVHHGGSGTTHVAAKSGVPQCAIPQLADQFYWGHQLVSLGLGPAPVAPHKLTTGRLTKMFRQLTMSSDFRDRARHVASSMDGENGVRGAVAVIGDAPRTEAASQSDSHRAA